MEIVIAAVVVAVGLAAGLVAAANLLAKRVPGYAAHPARVAPATGAAPAAPAAPETTDQLERTAAMGRLEERLETREAELERRGAELERYADRLRSREAELSTAREESVRKLEQASGLSASQAKHLLLKELEDQARHDAARRLRQIET
jgi:ribonucrease Y